MQLESDYYDVVVIGTGLAESIAAASLAKIGKTVLHIDPNEYYGGDQASLTLDELIDWAQFRSSSTEHPSSSKSPYLTSQSRRYTQASTTALSPALESQKRRYALSLFPTILPSRGSLISTLISSDVSKYVSFRMLDSVSIWSDNEDSGVGKGFVRKVPGSKEEVFKDKSIGLLDKRRLMKFLMFAAGDFESDPVILGKETRPLLELLKESFLIPETLAESIAFAIAHCNSPNDPTLPALVRARRYLKSIGRYGSSAFLVGQYGGAGEVAQGFCRACAVFAGTYVLGHSGQPESIELAHIDSPGPGPIRLKLPCHPQPISAKHLISSPDHLRIAIPTDDSSPITSTAHCIAILPSLPESLKKRRPAESESGLEDSPDPEGDDDTAVVIFPPVEGDSVVRALIMGEGTGSCPPGQFILYLSQEIGPGQSTNVPPSDILKSYLRRLAPDTLFECYYYSNRPSSSHSDLLEKAHPGVVLLKPYSGSELLTEGLDYAADQGQVAFRRVMSDVPESERKEFFEKVLEEGEEPDDDL